MSGKDGITLTQQATEEAMWQTHQKQIRAELADYALALSGTPDDIDPELEAAGLEVWQAADQ